MELKLLIWKCFAQYCTSDDNVLSWPHAGNADGRRLLSESDLSTNPVEMASLFATQLRQIAVNTTNELDLKAQKAAHAESLIFEKKISGSQDFDTIYQICIEGYQDLCRLDARFDNFQRSLFSPQSRNQDRTQMTVDENAALDAVVEAFLGLVGGKLLLRPAVKAIEWLVRRFKSVSQLPFSRHLADRSTEFMFITPNSCS